MSEKKTTAEQLSRRQKIGRGLGLFVAAGLAAAGASLVVNHIEKPAPPTEVTLTSDQHQELDKTAAGTAKRLLDDKFALSKQVTVGEDATTITVLQNMGMASRRQSATLVFTFAGKTKGTDIKDTEDFLRTEPAVEHISIQKIGKFTLDVEEGDNGVASVQMQMPDIALHPHNDALALGDLSGFQRSLYIANGVYGYDVAGGIPESYRDRILPSDVPAPVDHDS